MIIIEEKEKNLPGQLTTERPKKSYNNNDRRRRKREKPTWSANH